MTARVVTSTMSGSDHEKPLFFQYSQRSNTICVSSSSPSHCGSSGSSRKRCIVQNFLIEMRTHSLIKIINLVDGRLRSTFTARAARIKLRVRRHVRPEEEIAMAENKPRERGESR